MAVNTAVIKLLNTHISHQCKPEKFKEIQLPVQ